MSIVARIASEAKKEREREEKQEKTAQNTARTSATKCVPGITYRLTQEAKKRREAAQPTSSSRSSAASRNATTGTGGTMGRITSGAAAHPSTSRADDEIQQTTQEPRRANLLDLTLGSVKRGYVGSRKGQEAYKAMMGQENELEEYTRRLEDSEYNFRAEGVIGTAVSGAAELLGQQVRQWTDPRSLSAAGGAAALASVAGKAGPQALVPEEIVTVPAAFGIGMQAGSTLSNFEIEAGNAYLEMLENGISEGTAKKIALVVGGGNAALEGVQLDELFKGMKILQKSGADETVLNRIKRVLIARGLDVANETAQEVAQEGVTIAGSQAASKLEKGDWEYDRGEVASRLGETALSSALSFGVLNLPGGARNIYAAVQDGKRQTTPTVQVKQTGAQEVDLSRAADSEDLLRRAAEEVSQQGRVSNRTATDILDDANVMEELARRSDLDIQDGMSKSQRRKAVKTAVEAIVEAQDGVSTDTREATPAAAQTQQTATQRPVATEQRTVAQQAYDMSRIREAANSLGENGAKALSASYDGSVRVDNYYAGFANYYEAGISGMDMKKVQSQYAAQLTEAQKFAAYSAGQNDAAVSLALEREGVKSATVYGDEAGFVQSEHSAHLSKDAIRTYNSMARAIGAKIQMEASTGDGGANGWYANGIIHIAANAKNPGIVVAKHEITHHLQAVAPEAYRKYRDYAANALAEQDGGSFALVEKYKQRYAEQAKQILTTEQAMDEIAADFTEALVVDPARFETLAKNDRSVARKVLDAVRDFLRKVKALFKGNKSARNQAAADAFGVSIDTLEEAARLWTEALKAASRQAATLQGKGDGATMGAAKLSLKDMTEGEGAALLQYKSSESYKINTKLRDGVALTEAEQKMVADLDAALEKLPVHEGTVYRRLSFDMEGQEALDAFLAEHAEGDIVPYEAYTSSSTAVDGYPVSGELTVTLVINSKTGRDMAGIGNNFESEVVFPRGRDFIVERVTQDAQGSPVIYMKEDAENGIGQLHSEERVQAVQQVQEKGERRDSLHEISETDTARGAGERKLPGVRGGGKEVRFSLKGDKTSWEDYPGAELTDPSEIMPVNEVTDPAKYEYLVNEFRETGYAGRPIVVYETPYGWQALTGSHRIYAAREADIEIPAVRITDSAVIERLEAITNDSDLQQEARWLFEDELIDQQLMELLSREEDLNAENFDVPYEKQRRFSLEGDNTLKENAALRQENELLRERVDYWKGQTRRTTRVTTDKKAVAKAAKQLIERYGAEIAAEDIQGDLQSLYDYLASGYDGKDELTWEESYRRARNIAQTLVENAVAVDDTMYEQYSDLRDYLRTTKIVYGKEYQGDIPDFNDFRKRNFGRLNLSSEGATNIDQVYQEMSGLWPELFDEQAQNNPTDQLLHIAEVLDGLYDITEHNPFSQYMDQAVTGAANEVMEQFFDLPQTRKTFADRQAAKLDAAKAKGRQQVQRVREQRDAKLATLREQNRERVQRDIARERETRARQINALKDRYAAKDAKGREQRTARELRGKIIRHAKALSQKLLHPSDKQHIPESLRGAAAAMLESINLESQYSVNEDGKRTKNGDGSPTRRTEAFRALKEQYAKIAAEGGGGLVIDPSLLGSDAEGIQGSFDAVIAMKDTKLADMSADQLATVWQVVKAVEHSVNTAGKVLSKAKYARTADWAQAISADSGSRRAKTSLTKSHALIDLETPYTYFSHYGEAGKAVYRMLRDAQDQQQLMVNRVAEEVRKIVGPKTVKKLEETTRTFTTERGDELTLSTAQIMELYELTKRKQAHDHLLKGGIVQPEVKSAKIRRGTDSILLTAGDLANITGTLTAEQVSIADGLQVLTCGLLADYGNRASMDAYGYKKFTEKDYWPIKSAKEGLHSNIEKGGSNTRSIKNIGMAKTTMPHASNVLDLAGIFTTFSNHAADMTDYASWLCTMEDANRLFNYQFRDEEGDLTGKTIKGLLDRVGGPGSQKYWHNLMEDIQNGIKAKNDSALTGIFEKGVGSFKGAAVGANARVVIQQPTAFFRAGAVLDAADMIRGIAGGATKGNGWKKALRYSPIAMRKDAGGFDISNPSQMKETLFDNRTRVRKLNDTLSAPAGAADAWTWGKLWNACEWATARDHQGLAKGSEAFYQQTAKLFAEVIDQTQVVDGVLQRSNIMRSSSALAQQATAFMGEPIMSLNLLMRSYDQMRYEQDSKKRSKAIKTLGRAATALVVTNVVNALAQSIVDAARDDDEDKKYLERLMEAFTGITGDEETFKDYLTTVLAGNLGDNMNLLGNIPYVKDGLSLARGYSVGRSDMEVVSDLVDAAKLFVKSADGEGTKTTAYSVKALLSSAAKLFGIPVSNLTRDVWGLARSAAVETDNIPLQYEMEKAIYNITNSGNYTRYYDILYRALEVGDTEVYEHIYADMVENGIPEDKIRSGMESRMKKAQGVGSVTDLENRFLSPQQTENYERVYNRVTGSAAWSAANAEQREALEDDLYDLTVGNSDGAKLQEKIDGGAAYGIDETDYLLYRLALHIADQPSESGKLGSYTGEEVEAAIDMLPGLDDEARAYLWAAAGKSGKSNPYK